MGRNLTIGAAVLGTCLLVACSGDGGADPSGGAGEAWGELIASRGTPTIFSTECTRHAFDASTGMWSMEFLSVPRTFVLGSSSSFEMRLTMRNSGHGSAPFAVRPAWGREQVVSKLPRGLWIANWGCSSDI